MRVLPADHQDQRHCCGCNREQDDQTGGLSPTGSGRSSDLGDQVPEGVSPVFHCCLLGEQRDGALPSAAYKLVALKSSWPTKLKLVATVLTCVARLLKRVHGETSVVIARLSLILCGYR